MACNSSCTNAFGCRQCHQRRGRHSTECMTWQEKTTCRTCASGVAPKCTHVVLDERAVVGTQSRQEHEHLRQRTLQQKVPSDLTSVQSAGVLPLMLGVSKTLHCVNLPQQTPLLTVECTQCWCSGSRGSVLPGGSDNEKLAKCHH